MMLYRIEEVCGKVQTPKGDQLKGYPQNLTSITLVLCKLTEDETDQVRSAILTLIKQLKGH